MCYVVFKISYVPSEQKSHSVYIMKVEYIFIVYNIQVLHIPSV